MKELQEAVVEYNAANNKIKEFSTIAAAFKQKALLTEERLKELDTLEEVKPKAEAN